MGSLYFLSDYVSDSETDVPACVQYCVKTPAVGPSINAGSLFPTGHSSILRFSRTKISFLET